MDEKGKFSMILFLIFFFQIKKIWNLEGSLKKKFTFFLFKIYSGLCSFFFKGKIFFLVKFVFFKKQLRNQIKNVKKYFVNSQLSCRYRNKDKRYKNT